MIMSSKMPSFLYLSVFVCFCVIVSSSTLTTLDVLENVGQTSSNSNEHEHLTTRDLPLSTASVESNEHPTFVTNNLASKDMSLTTTLTTETEHMDEQFSSSTPTSSSVSENEKYDSKTEAKKKLKLLKKKEKQTTVDGGDMKHVHMTEMSHKQTTPEKSAKISTKLISDAETTTPSIKMESETTTLPTTISETEITNSSPMSVDQDIMSHETISPETTNAESTMQKHSSTVLPPTTMDSDHLNVGDAKDIQLRTDKTIEDITSQTTKSPEILTDVTDPDKFESTMVEMTTVTIDSNEEEHSAHEETKVALIPTTDLTIIDKDHEKPSSTDHSNDDSNNLNNSLYDSPPGQPLTSTMTESKETVTTAASADEYHHYPSSTTTAHPDDENHRQRKQMSMEEPHACPCDDSKMVFDMTQCLGERTAQDPSCPCRTVCAGQFNHPCNDSTTPCDHEFFLHCQQETHSCQGPLSIQFLDVTHNSAQVKWGSEKLEQPTQATVSYTTAYRGSHTQWIEVNPTKPITLLENLVPNAVYFLKVEEDGKQEIGIFQTKDGCIFNATLSFAVGEKFNLSCNQTCTCYAGGEPECHDRCYYVPVDMRHPSCVEVPDENDPCCVRLQCTDNIAGSPPKVLVTELSPSTMTVVWDDFKLPSHHSQYVLEYRSANNQSWMQIQAGSQPIITVTQLKPNTDYQVRVAVWEDGSRKLELPSEVVVVHTKDGCIKDNKTYGVGDEYFHGCDMRCICQGGDEETCNPRCNPPYIKVGTKADEPMCYEKPLPSDPCCVMLRCSEGKSLEPGEGAAPRIKAGECPESVEESLSTAKSCLSDCDHDGDCSGSMKCCPSSCGGAVCIQPVVVGNICENIYCGPNAKCIAEKMSCECMEGYEGNAHDFLTGCKLGLKSENNSSENPNMKMSTNSVSSTVTFTTPIPMSSTMASAKHPDNIDNHLAPSTEAPFELDLSSKSEDKTEPPIVDESAPNSGEDYSSIKDVPHPHKSIDATNHSESRALEREEDILNSTDEDDDNKKGAKKKTNLDVPLHFDGCEYNNITYDRGVRFDDACESRCICDAPGHVSCVPRCSVLSSGGKSCKEVPDPDDKCCKIMICNFPGNEEMGNVDELSLKILSAEPRNGTTIRIRLALSSSKLPAMVGQESLEIWYVMAGDEQSNLSQWNKRPVVLKELNEVQHGVFEFDVSGLTPDSDYFVKVAKESQGPTKLHMAEFSNTVNVKTFPAAVKTVFQGCFLHNQSYHLGEVFYQGCESKCICRENGFIECQDRCEIYIDTVGYEGCEWIPSEEDSCCIVPSCQRRKIPLIPGSRLPPFIGPVENMCVINSNEFYRVGDIWELDDGCKTNICRCALLPNGTTTIQCQSECPALPPNAHIPTARCPNPVLVKPDGPCSCHYISCNETPRRAVQPPRPQCEFKGKRYEIGQEFHDGCIALCHCGQDLRVSCAAIECPYHFSAEFTNCLEWDIDPDFFPMPPQCCAPSKCKNDGSCLFSGQKFNNFEDIPTDLLPCGARCVCVNGNVTCENRCPPVEDVPPPNLPCPPSLAYKAHPIGETCCLRWMCKEPAKQGSICLFQGTRYVLSEQWEVRKGSTRRLCSCHMDENGIPQVECKGGCPQIPQRFLLPSEQCARPVIITPDDPVMCPYVVCNNTVTAQELYNVNVVALNSTAVRIRFTLANILVGLVGHAELHFTTDPTLPPTEWHVQKFSRPKRLFDSPNIEYILNALRPNTTYFLQVRIKIDALQGGPESELFKLRMPEELVPTSTTTLPPIIMLDAKPEVHVIDANTARISWRNFEPQEKKFIYAVQLKYKKVNEAEDKWITTPMIHRDVTSYFLHDLEPSSPYMVDMIFTAPKEMPTKLISAKSLEFRTIGKSKNDYNLKVSVNENKLDAESTEFSLVGIPEPVTKYVHVVKILYKTPEGDQQYSFKVPKASKVELDHLEPGKKYLAQMELYLTNGHTLTSNEVEFITKPAKLGAAGHSPQENVIIDNHHTNGKVAEPLQSKEDGIKDDENRAYFIALVVVAVVAAVAGFGFILLLVLLVRRQASAKAPISRTPSESAYDNPTYKTYDGERLEDKTNGQAIQTTQA